MKDNERCGMCAWSQETEKIDEVECHGGLPQVSPIPMGGQLTFVSYFPRMSALRGWCKHFEEGEMVRMSRILPAGVAR